MKSHKYGVMARFKAHGVYSNYFVKHVGITDLKAWVEFTHKPDEALIVYGRDTAHRYSMLLTRLMYDSRVSFFSNKIGRVCRPNAYAVRNKSNGQWLIFKHRDIAEYYNEYYCNLEGCIYPLYGFVGDYDYPAVHNDFPMRGPSSIRLEVVANGVLGEDGVR